MSRFILSCNNPKIGSLELSERPVAIGRHPDNDISINDDVASRFHCVIEHENGKPVLRDLGSRNGTRLNGSRVSESALSAGDVITIGTHSFSVDVVAPVQAKGPAPAAARGKGRTVAPAWALELEDVIASLPPKDAPPEDITLIDASGRPSEALMANADGPRAVRLLLQLASKSRATDIHCEPRRDSMQVRMRVDGQMVAIIDLPSAVGELLMGVVKAACELQQAARDAVLDGHFSARYRDRRVDFRASFTPTVHGQKLVIRVLDARTAPQSLGDLNLPAYMYQAVKRICDQDAGFLLVSGPTGSGKTTTLYNALREIDRDRRNVVTIEDPVEYSIEGVTQMPVGRNSSFGSLLRSVLRQDPDVIFVGEIRDDETARTAMQAAMTGHVVFSTVHAKDTIGAVFRLLDLGVEPYLVANSMEVIVAQRLLRVLCEYCKRPVRVTPGQATRMGRYLEGKSEVYAATGCARCLRTGYNGRHAIFEMLQFNDQLRDTILNNPTIQQMKEIIGEGVFTTLQQSGWLMAARGMTALDEVERVAGNG